MTVTRGFTGRRAPGHERLPSGQYAETGFPVMSIGPAPAVTADTWEFTITTETGDTRSWDWERFASLPAERITKDLHCVTKWSKLDTTWRGVSLDTLLEGVPTAATHVMAVSADGYTTNLPLKEIKNGKAWLAFEYEGEPLDPEHGGPVRLLVPRLYLWKSAKWVTGLRLMRRDEPGFWEDLGYHDYGDPWREQRYRGELGAWRAATVTATRDETATARTIVLDVLGLPAHLPGQTVDVKLTAADGYDAQRSYSIASAPGRAGHLELTVQRTPGGEVSEHLTRELRPGDAIEVRGPVGGSFAWDPDEDGRPLLLVAGGSGIVPLMSMIRSNPGKTARLIYSARTPADIIYAAELSERITASPLAATFCYTREAPPGARLGRIDAAVIAGAGLPPEDKPEVFVCGPEGFVAAAVSLLIEAGHDPEAIRTERFG